MRLTSETQFKMTKNNWIVVSIVLSIAIIIFSFVTGTQVGMQKMCDNSKGAWVKGDKCINITNMGYCLGTAGAIHKGPYVIVPNTTNLFEK